MNKKTVDETEMSIAPTQLGYIEAEPEENNNNKEPTSLSPEKYKKRLADLERNENMAEQSLLSSKDIDKQQKNASIKKQMTVDFKKLNDRQAKQVALSFRPIRIKKSEAEDFIAAGLPSSAFI